LIRYHQNTKKLNEIFTFFFLQDKLAFFRSTSHNKLFQLDKNWSNLLEPSWRKRS